MVILHLTEVLPAPIPIKRHENNALLVSVHTHRLLYPESQHVLVLVVPYINFIGALFSRRRKQYFQLRKLKQYEEEGLMIQVIAIPSSGYKIPFLRSVLDLLSWWYQKNNLIHLAQKHKVSLIHAHNVYNTANLARHLSIKQAIPYVITTRNIPQFFKSVTIKNNLKKASALISLNHAYKLLAEQLAPSVPSFLIPHGIDQSFFNYARNTSEKTASPILRLVSISRLIPLKNIDKILYALDGAKFDFVYHIYGDGPEFTHLKHLCLKLNLQSKVKFQGHLDHSKVPETLSIYDVFIMPSFPETLGRVFFEAMSIGLPIIAAKRSGIEGYIEHGVSGFLVDPHNISELSEIICLLAKAPQLRISIGKNAQEIASTYSWENNLHQLQKIYTSLVL